MPTVSPWTAGRVAADSAADLLVADLSTIVQAERPAGQSGNVLAGVGGDRRRRARGRAGRGRAAAPGRRRHRRPGRRLVALVLRRAGGREGGRTRADRRGRGGVTVGASATRAGPLDSSTIGEHDARRSRAPPAPPARIERQPPAARPGDVACSAAAPHARHHSCSGASVRRSAGSGARAARRAALGCGSSGGVCVALTTLAPPARAGRACGASGAAPLCRPSSPGSPVAWRRPCRPPPGRTRRPRVAAVPSAPVGRRASRRGRGVAPAAPRASRPCRPPPARIRPRPASPSRSAGPRRPRGVLPAAGGLRRRRRGWLGGARARSAFWCALRALSVSGAPQCAQ